MSVPYHRNVNIDKAWPYTVTVAPVNLPVTLDEVKTQLRIDLADVTQDTLLTLLINVATEFAEGYTKLDFISRTQETLRDCFWDSLVIRRSPIQSVSTVEYLKDDVLTTVSTDVYFVTESNTFPHLSLKPNQSWPTDEDAREQAVKVTFISGFGDDPDDVPDDLRQALLIHIAALYENRGDCDENRVSSSQAGAVQKLLPVDAQLIYDFNRIRSI